MRYRIPDHLAWVDGDEVGVTAGTYLVDVRHGTPLVLHGSAHLKGVPASAPQGTQPWFRIPWRRSAGERLVFGHWSAMGYVNEDGVLGLDTGCVWGGTLAAQRIDVPDALPIPDDADPATVQAQALGFVAHLVSRGLLQDDT